MLAMPTALLRVLQRRFARLPPGSQLRRRGLKRLMTLGSAAANRGDYEVPLLFYEPDMEIQADSELARTLGLAESYHGHQGVVEAWRDLLQDMTEARFEPERVIDLGDPVAVRLTGAAVGRSSPAQPDRIPTRLGPRVAGDALLARQRACGAGRRAHLPRYDSAHERRTGISRPD
jgi:hypothetical protein